MSQSGFPRMAAYLILSAATLFALPGCTKRLDTSNEEKYYKTLTEVVNSLPAAKQKEFDDGMTTLWFYSSNDEETYAKINGKTGREILAVIEELNASIPKLDTSSKDAYTDSLAKIKATLPPSKIQAYNEWLREMPPYRQGNPKIDALNGLTFQKIVENRDFTNGQNPALQNK